MTQATPATNLLASVSERIVIGNSGTSQLWSQINIFTSVKLFYYNAGYK